MISSSFEDLELEIDLMHFEPQKRFRWQKNEMGSRYQRPTLNFLIFWATVCKTVRPMLSLRCLSCLSVLSVCPSSL